MSWFDKINFGNSKDIIIDEGAIDKAIADFEGLSNSLQKLREDIEAILQVLKEGFDTPAGNIFFNSCESNLLTPLDQQKAVIDEIYGTLRDVKGAYSSVFTEFDSLNKDIKSYQF